MLWDSYTIYKSAASIAFALTTGSFGLEGGGGEGVAFRDGEFLSLYTSRPSPLLVNTYGCEIYIVNKGREEVQRRRVYMQFFSFHFLYLVCQRKRRSGGTPIAYPVGDRTTRVLRQEVQINDYLDLD